MSYKYLKLLPLIAFFMFFWLFLNRTNIIIVNNNSDLLNILTSYAGYNYLMLHGTIYALLFLLLLFSSIPNNITQLMVRMSRKKFIKNVITNVILQAFIFVGIFTSINLILTLYFVDVSILVKSRFFIGIIISFVSTILLYILIGTVFSIFFVYSFSEAKSLIFTFIISTILVCGDLILGWKTPFHNTVVYDYLLSSGFNLINFLYICIKNIVLIYCAYYILITIFKEKDIINVKI